MPCEIDAHAIDRLLVDQEWRCAISHVPLKAPGNPSAVQREAFAPSIDRIVPALGYVPGNVRVVCNIVNAAMSEWGLDSLMTLVDLMAAKIINEGRARRRKYKSPKTCDWSDSPGWVRFAQIGIALRRSAT